MRFELEGIEVLAAFFITLLILGIFLFGVYFGLNMRA